MRCVEFLVDNDGIYLKSLKANSPNFLDPSGHGSAMGHPRMAPGICQGSSNGFPLSVVPPRAPGSVLVYNPSSTSKSLINPCSPTSPTMGHHRPQLPISPFFWAEGRDSTDAGSLRQYSWANQKPALGNSWDLRIPRKWVKRHGLLSGFWTVSVVVVVVVVVAVVADVVVVV